jgi:uncharacterized protein YyaL (SSP411 family)
MCGMRREPLPPPDVIRSLPPDGGAEFNRLIHETSPYLLQHARNPVDWYPWGNEAKARAAAEDKPIFLSVGYSACHWCHVMERESFENPEIAEVLNTHFIPVKVDREERPDIDEYYMLVTQLLTGRGGWPNSVWLLPDGTPWYAGTYFPPDDRYGRLGFKSLLARLAEIWETRRADVEAQARQIAAAIRFHTTDGGPRSRVTLDELLEAAYAAWASSYDLRHGGFGDAPKFPPHSALALILHHTARHPNPARLALATGTLDAMLLGGIRDHIGGGFHRYSTDAHWLLPHFEKMLYDNAQLARIYAEAARRMGADRRAIEYEAAARETLEWVLREMTASNGAFFSALDADSEGEEGRFYLWSQNEILDALGPDDGALFCEHYQIRPEGNFRDEATGRQTGLNIPHLAAPLPETLRERMANLRRALLACRVRRESPGLDDKCLTGWNGLMIEALAKAGVLLDEPRYIDAARRAARAILTDSTTDGELMRVQRQGRAHIPAYLEDYAALALGLLALFDADANAEWLDAAERCGRAIVERFIDPLTGLPMPTGPQHEKLPARWPDVLDQAMPSSTAITIQALAGLSDRGRGTEYRTVAERAFAAALPRAARSPTGCASLLHAGLYLRQTDGADEVRLSVRQIHASEGRLQLSIEFALPPGWHLQPYADGLSYRLEADESLDVIERRADRVTVCLRETKSGAGSELRIAYRPCDASACRPEVVRRVFIE